MKKTTAFLASLFFLALTGFASAEFKDNGNGTITDTSTNLMWQKTYGFDVTWDTANSYCTQSGTGGHFDWRMPTLTELQLLVDPKYSWPCIDPVFACYYGEYWTSSVVGGSAWTVDFTEGGAGLLPKSRSVRVSIRCARGATTPAGCISVGSDLTINLPCVYYNGKQYDVTLKAYTDPALPLGVYWILDNAEEK